MHPEYAALIDNNYDGQLFRVDYRGEPDAARKKINAWVEDKTNDRICNLLTAAEVTDETRSVLVNTIYFKADWLNPFEKANTKSEDFYLASGGKVRWDLMHGQGSFAYLEKPDFNLLRMPYRGEETEMVVLLPDRPAELSALEEIVDASKLDSWLDEAAEHLVRVTIPKFKLNSRFKLKAPLRELGMTIPFSNESDFSGAKLVNSSSPDREDWNLKLTEVVHQVFVEVEEKGTEAAAATALVSIIVTSARPPQSLKTFRADHPFLFFIRDRRTGAILFIGRFSGEAA